MGDKNDSRRFAGKAKRESAWDRNRKRLYKGRVLDGDVKDVPSHNISQTRITRNIGLYNAGQKSTTVKRESVSNLQSENQARLSQNLNNLLQLATDRRQNAFSRKNHEESSLAADSMVSNWIMSGQINSPQSWTENDILEIAKDSFDRVNKNVEDKINERFPDGDNDYVRKKKISLQSIFHRSYRCNQSGSNNLYTKNISKTESPISSPTQSFSYETPTFDKHEPTFSCARNIQSHITPKNEEFVPNLEPKTFDPPKMDFPIFSSTPFIDSQQPIPTAEKQPNASSAFDPSFRAGRPEHSRNVSSGQLHSFPTVDSPMPRNFMPWWLQ